MVLGPEEIDGEAHPAGGKNDYTADYFTHKRDGLLDDVDDCQDRQHKTDEIDYCCHTTNITNSAEFPKSDALPVFLLNL